MPTHGRIDSYVQSQESWTAYTERLEHYFVANDTADNKKKSILLTVCGPSTYELARSLVQPAQLSDKSFADIVKALGEYYNPKPSPIIQRYKFHSRVRNSGESIATYVAALRTLGEHCNFGGTLSDMLRDRLVCGVNDHFIQRRLLQEPALTYKTAFDIAVAMEAATRDAHDLRKPVTTSHSVQHVGQQYHSQHPRGNFQSCHRCGDKTHTAKLCRFQDAQCRACGKKGHLARVCMSKQFEKKQKPNRNLGQQGQRRVHTLEEVEPPRSFDVEPKPLQEDTEPFPVYTLNHKSHPLEAPVMVNKVKLIMEIDTGAALSLISEGTYSSIFSSFQLHPTDIQLRTYNGELLPVLGSFEVDVEYESQRAALPLLVVKGRGPSLLGRNWLSIIRLDWNNIHRVDKMSTIDQLLGQHANVFRDELGSLKDCNVQINIKEGASPRFFKPRSVSYYLKEKVENELRRLQRQGVITPVVHSNWATPIVPVLKSDSSVRICGDYKVTINPVAKQDTYPLPKIDDVFSSLTGGKVFSKLDLAHAYQQLQLDTDSKQLTTINTHKGLFQYNRLPFGISAAPSIFQRTLESLLADIPKISIYLDDILVSGINEKDHLETLNKVLTRLGAAGLTLKKSKCEFLLKSVEYLGHIIDQNGLHPSPGKLRAIRDAPMPKNVHELKSFLGLINYYHKFISNLSCILSPLYRLLKKGSRWIWSDDQNRSFQAAKQLLQSSTVLIHFDPSKPLIISADASPYGLGAVLSHQLDDGSDQPITFVSRTLSDAEKKYSQIEKEALAIIFAVKRFHQYIHGRSFCIHSDHKPLQFLFDKSHQVPLMASSRIQRWALTLGAYNYNIRYKPGTSIPHAGALSRLPLHDNSNKSSPSPDVVHLINHLATTVVNASQIRQWTDKDPTLSRVRRLVSSGWTLTDPEPPISPYHCRRHELSIIDGCLLWGSRIIIPSVGRSTVLSLLHECHPGVSRMKKLARSYVWWPNMDSDIESTVRSCQPCQINRPSPPRAPIHPWEYPTRPWARLHIDHAGPYLGHYFLIIVDAFSKWIEAHIVSSTSSEASIKVLRSVFATHGIPENIVSDNGTGFTSQEFQTFMSENGIKHTRTSPYHPSSNGLAERAVQTVKHGIAKLEGTISHRLARFLLSYRITPQTTTGLSPAELLMGRKLHTLLDRLHPDSTKRIAGKQEDKQIYAEVIKQRRFTVGDKLYAKDYSGRSNWIPVIVKEITGPLSYKLETESGLSIRRHVDQLRFRYNTEVENHGDDSMDFGPFPSNSRSTPPDPPGSARLTSDSSVHNNIHPSPPIRRSSRIRRPVLRYSPVVSS